jgi:archaetidylinositol phosphate synthase
MTLDRLRPVADRALTPVVSACSRLGLGPNGVSVVAMILALGAGGAFVFAKGDARLYAIGAVLVFLNGVLDLVDGALARRLGTDSAAGDLLDHVLDRYADIVVVAGLAAGVEQYALGFAAVTGVLMTSYLGTQAQAVGVDRVYGGLLGRADRLALVGIVGVSMVVVPDPIRGFTLVGWLLALFAVLGHATAIQRFYLSMRALR